LIKKIFIIFISFFILTLSKTVAAKRLSTKSLEKYINKISYEFSRTFCNTIQFGISEESAIAFVIGETNKEFKKNRLKILTD
tara:strand:- start:265 stop:510 length:246 start_codon:yes stop_codon:yes gene_type:complete